MPCTLQNSEIRSLSKRLSRRLVRLFKQLIFCSVERRNFDLVLQIDHFDVMCTRSRYRPGLAMLDQCIIVESSHRTRSCDGHRGIKQFKQTCKTTCWSCDKQLAAKLNDNYNEGVTGVGVFASFFFSGSSRSTGMFYFILISRVLGTLS